MTWENRIKKVSKVFDFSVFLPLWCARWSHPAVFRTDRAVAQRCQSSESRCQLPWGAQLMQLQRSTFTTCWWQISACLWVDAPMSYDLKKYCLSMRPTTRSLAKTWSESQLLRLLSTCLSQLFTCLASSYFRTCRIAHQVAISFAAWKTHNIMKYNEIWLIDHEIHRHNIIQPKFTKSISSKANSRDEYAGIDAEWNRTGKPDQASVVLPSRGTSEWPCNLLTRSNNKSSYVFMAMLIQYLLVNMKVSALSPKASKQHGTPRVQRSWTSQCKIV